MNIYQSCDIRGSAATELTPQLYRNWGVALGRQLASKDKFVVGSDWRASSASFLAALIDGLCQTGVDVVDVGVLPTPMIYYAKARLQAGGCAIVTGSHHPTPINGLKWMVGEEPPTRADVLSLQRDTETPSRSDVKLDEESASVDVERARTKPRTLDVSFDYVACLQEQFVGSLAAQRRVVLDPMAGCWAGKVRRYLNAIFPNCLFSTIRNVPIPDFAGHTPDCSSPDELHELCDAVYRERANLGIAFDGDGDRLALIDNEGVALTVDETTWVLLQSFGEAIVGESFVYDIKLSDRIIETAQQLHATPLVERSGPALIHARMRQTNALFGVEAGGHYFYRDLESRDDSLYTACRLIAWLARHPDQTLADLRRACPAVYITPDLCVPLAPELQTETIELIRKAWSQFPQQVSDSVRINTPSGWILVTSSVSEPSLIFRFEGLDWSALDHLVERFCRSLPDLGGVLWQRYKAAMGMQEDPHG